MSDQVMLTVDGSEFRFGGVESIEHHPPRYFQPRDRGRIDGPRQLQSHERVILKCRRATITPELLALGGKNHGNVRIETQRDVFDFAPARMVVQANPAAIVVEATTAT